MKSRALTLHLAHIRAIVDDRKTQHRILMPWQPFPAVTKNGQVDHCVMAGMVLDTDWVWPIESWYRVVSSKSGPHPEWVKKHQRNRVGDTLWVRPTVTTPRGKSPVSLKIVGIKIERVQDISPEDAEAEGVFRYVAEYSLDKVFRNKRKETAVQYFRELWERAHGDESWTKNPYVEVVMFERMK